MRRYRFIPETIWVDDDDGWMIPLRRHENPDTWMSLCESDEPIIVQVDDGRTEEDRGIFPTSSSSSPIIMREMIDELAVEPGMKILEIGTGTGYNAALLAEIAGAGNVTTVEVDPDIADHARAALRDAGLTVTVVIGDGANGHPAGAPYDRMIATAAVQRVPYPWIDQSRVGARIVVPWSSAFAPGGALLTLTTRDDGTAIGGFGKEVGFMFLREQRTRVVPWVEDDQEGDYIQSATRIHPGEVFENESEATFAIGARIPGLSRGETINENGVHTLRLSHHDSVSWASFTPGENEHTVRQHGPRRLWDELESAYQWWIDAGRPEHTRFGVIVTPQEQRVWLDSPDKTVSSFV